MAKNYEIDMSQGALMGKIIRFSIPLMLTSVLQLLFNAADTVVVGRFAGSEALAAVGSTGALINLIVNLFMGFSVGANVLVARYFGSQDSKNLSEAVHTSVVVGLVGGIAVGIIGFFAAPPLLQIMGTPEDVLPKAALYTRVYFAGMPFTGMYNFGAAILRSVGDTKRPLYFLSIAGVVNVVLNLFFVITFHMNVAGVALATVISNGICAVLIFITLLKTDAAYGVRLNKLRIHKDKLVALARVGIPSGIQGMVFSFSNMTVQSAVNSFGSVIMAGNTAAANLEGFLFVALNAFHHAALAATGQSVGAGRPERVKKVLGVCATLVTVIGLAVGLMMVLFRGPLINIYSSDPEVIEVGMTRMVVMCSLYFTCGLMDMMVGCIRGMGYSVMPTIVSLLGACGVRVAWVMTIFAAFPTIGVLYAVFPISWIVSAAAHFGCFLAVYKRFMARNQPKTA